MHMHAAHLNLCVGCHGVVELHVGIREPQREQRGLQGHEREVLVKQLPDPLHAAIADGGVGQLLHQLGGKGGGEVEVHGLVQSVLGVLGEKLHVGLGGRQEVNCGDIRDALALRLDEQVQCDAVFAQIADPEQGRDDVLGELVED